MATEDNNSRKPAISKKWLYGSLAVIALILGLYLDNSAVAAEYRAAVNSVTLVKINPQEGHLDRATASEDNDSDSVDRVDSADSADDFDNNNDKENNNDVDYSFDDDMED